jgi:alkanesulfonate monooxygenase SsuD/methylene tetrahydromethanopterin reductase-like flavin-dependent oxidoreductase (luciferase family)
MAKDEACPGSCAIVVGEPDSELVQTVARLARERGIGAVPCVNVYEAVVAMAQAAGRRILVVGRIRDLAVDNGIFLRISAARAARCCCLLEADRTAGPQDLLAAARANATIVGSVPEVLAALQDWSATAGPHGAVPAQRPVWEQGYENLRATEAELRALLE